LPQVFPYPLSATSQRRQQEEQAASIQDRVADSIAGFTGKDGIGLLPFIGFRRVDSGKPGTAGWLPGTRRLVFGDGRTTFVMISQNRMDRPARKRAELDLQTNPLAEHEITRVVKIV